MKLKHFALLIEQKEKKIVNTRRKMAIIGDPLGQMKEKIIKTENEIKKLKEDLNFYIDYLELNKNQ